MSIVDMCCSPRFSRCTLIDLEMSIQCAFNAFKVVHPNCVIIPKMHYLLLYPRLMTQLGPLSQYSCMRFEAKHKTMKGFVTERNCFKNVPYTIATNHQLKLSTLITRNDLFSRDIETKSAGRVDTSSVFQEFPSCPTTALTLDKKKQAKVDGIVYSYDCILCVNVSSEGLPEFMNVKDLFVDANAGLIFVGTTLETIAYNEHLHAWNVHESSKKCYCLHENLLYPRPLHINSPFGSCSKYVCPKFCLETTPCCVCVYGN